MPGMGKASAAAVAANCRASFPNVRLALVVGVCGVVPFGPGGEEMVLGDVVVSDGVVQYDLGWRLPERFVRKDTLLDALGRPNAEIRALLAKLRGRRGRAALRDAMAGHMEALRAERGLGAEDPGAARDRLFEATYRHVGDGVECDECGCDGALVPRGRLAGDDGPRRRPEVHFGLVASGDSVMMSGEERDAMARREGVVAFEMEGSGVWDSFPCVVIKGACDYADSHKSKVWQPYAAATAAACMKAFLGHWVPALPVSLPERPTGPWFLVPYPRNDSFVGRTSLLRELQQLPRKSTSQTRVALFGLGGIGKTQIALEHAYWLREACPDMSVFWVHASNAERFRQAYAWIAQECQIPGHDDPKADVLALVKRWLEREDHGLWLMVIDNADDTQLFFGQQGASENGSASGHEGDLGRYLPECSHGTILITTRNMQTGLKLTKGKRPIEVEKMDGDETTQLFHARLDHVDTTSGEIAALSSRLEYLPLALIQAAAFIQENTITVSEYLRLLEKSDQHLVDLLSEEFETVGRDSGTPRSVAETWVLSFEQIQRQNALAGELLSLMSLFDRHSIPLRFASLYCEHRQGDAQSELQLTKALGLLKAFSFIAGGEGRGFDMHRLVQLVTRKWLGNNGMIPRFAERAMLIVSHAYPFGMYENRAVCHEYLPHAYAVLRLEGTGSLDEKLARASLLSCVALYCDYLGQWKTAEGFQSEAARIRKEILGEEHLDTLSSISHLVSLYRDRGRSIEAESLGLEAMEISRRVLGDEHWITLSNMTMLSLIHQENDRWEEAEGLGEAEALGVQAMEGLKRVMGDEHPHTMTCMNNLALVWKTQGRLDEGLRLMEQCAQLHERILGLDHPHTVSSSSTLRRWRKETGRAITTTDGEDYEQT
ncbi:hypothetical protein CONLIGDRAFT_664815 [Coniochaeta ligniaria NRRL 30616]|uniref:Uncharacterized protein n=1 Tax=Coniochaeta ligniaria NRRL 30616 TaxID=1408157 RepID=A0A1J7I5H7_9PEZI|nr:hypothetical protein CONLIGDRAFT_664815 [Coniochaeta ligniaria NRRL 30616]